MKSAELVERLAHRRRTTKVDVRDFLEMLREELHDVVEREESVLVPGLFRLSVSHLRARRAKLPGREVDLPERTRVKLKPQPALIGGKP